MNEIVEHEQRRSMDSSAHFVKDGMTHLAMLSRNIAQVENFDWITRVTTFIASEDAFSYRLSLVYEEIVGPIMNMCSSGTNRPSIVVEGVPLHLKLSTKESRSKLLLLFGRIQTLVSTQQVILRKLREIVCKTLVQDIVFETVYTDLAGIMEAYLRFKQLYKQCGSVLSASINKSHKHSISNLQKALVAHQTVTLDEYFALVTSPHEELCDYELWSGIFGECSDRIDYLYNSLYVIKFFREDEMLQKEKFLSFPENVKPLSNLPHPSDSIVFDCSLVSYDTIQKVVSDSHGVTIECKKAHFTAKQTPNSGFQEPSSIFSLHEFGNIDLTKEDIAQFDWGQLQEFDSSTCIALTNSVVIVVLSFSSRKEKSECLEQMYTNLLPWDLLPFHNALNLAFSCPLCNHEFKGKWRRKACHRCGNIICKMCSSKFEEERICTDCQGDNRSPGLVLEECKEAGSPCAIEASFPQLDISSLTDIIQYYTRSSQLSVPDSSKYQSPLHALLLSETLFVNGLSILYHGLVEDYLDHFTTSSSEESSTPIFQLFTILETLYFTHKNFLSSITTRSSLTDTLSLIDLIIDFTSIVWPIYSEYIKLHATAIQKLHEMDKGSLSGHLIYFTMDGMGVEYWTELFLAPLMRIQQYGILFTELAHSMVQQSMVSSDIQEGLKLLWKVVSEYRNVVYPQFKVNFSLAKFDSQLILPKNTSYSSLVEGRKFLSSFLVDIPNEKHSMVGFMVHLFNDIIMLTTLSDNSSPVGKFELIDSFFVDELSVCFQDLHAQFYRSRKEVLSFHFRDTSALQEFNDLSHSLKLRLTPDCSSHSETHSLMSR